METLHHRILAKCALALFVAFSFAGTAQAGPQASAWSDAPHSRARLVRGMDPADGSYQVGVQIQLDAGWKTYWRNPGDSGIPPYFEWSRSDNLTDVTVHWPAPEWFQDAYGNSIGYHDEVVFPLSVTPSEGAVTAMLVLDLSYAVCAEVCIPVTLELELELHALLSSPRFASLIAVYEGRVPRPIDEISGLEVADVAVAEQDGRVSLIVDILCEDPSRDMSVFMEGPDRFYFAYPEEQETAPEGHKRFVFPVDGADTAEDLTQAELSFVVVDGDKRLQQAWIMP